jgi:hypothetical protein
MSPETETNIALLMATLSWLQREGGDVPPPGQVNPENLAELARDLGIPVSLSTLKRLDSISLAKARHAARQRGRSHFLSPEN